MLGDAFVASRLWVEDRSGGHYRELERIEHHPVIEGDIQVVNVDADPFDEIAYRLQDDTLVIVQLR